MVDRPRLLLFTLALLAAGALAAPPSAAEEARDNGLPRPGARMDVSLLEEVSLLTAELPEAEDALARLVDHLALSARDGATCLLSLRRRRATAAYVRFTTRVLEKVGDDRLVPYLLAMTADGANLEARAAAYAELGERAGPDAIEDLLLAMDADPLPLQPAADTAFTAVLTRHPRIDLLAGAWPKVSEETRARALTCLGKTGTPEAVSFVGRNLGLEGSLGVVALTSLGRLPPTKDSEDLLPRIRELLASRNALVRRQAVMVLGRWEDYSSIGTLIDLLDDEDPAMRRNVYWTLRRISGVDLPAHRDRWRVWYHREIDWWAEEGAELLYSLESGSDEEVLRAIEILSRRPLFRRIIQSSLLELGERKSGPVGAAARSAAGGLGVGGSTADAVMAAFAKRALPVRRVRAAPDPVEPERVSAASSFSVLPIVIGGTFLVLVLLHRLGMHYAVVNARRGATRRRGSGSVRRRRVGAR